MFGNPFSDFGLKFKLGTLGKEPNVTICYVELLGRMHTCVHLFKSNFGPDAHLCTGGVCTQVCKVHTCVRFFGDDFAPPTSNLLTCGSAFSPSYACMNCGDAV